jgi:hypothetical protein
VCVRESVHVYVYAGACLRVSMLVYMCVYVCQVSIIISNGSNPFVILGLGKVLRAVRASYHGCMKTCACTCTYLRAQLNNKFTQ